MGALARLTPVALAVCLLAAGCGTASKEDDIIAVSYRFHAAIAARDGILILNHVTRKITDANPFGFGYKYPDRVKIQGRLVSLLRRY